MNQPSRTLLLRLCDLVLLPTLVVAVGAFILACTTKRITGWTHLYAEMDFLFGLAIGAVLVLVLRLFGLHHYRGLGLVPLLILAQSLLAFGLATWGMDVLHGTSVAMIWSLLVIYTLHTRTQSLRPQGVWLVDVSAALVIGIGGLLICTQQRIANDPTLRIVHYSLLVFLLLFSWTRLFRPFFELCVEVLLCRGYRILAAGPGATSVPQQGPLIVIANHACFWDPLFLASVLPRPITPMMTSVYYDRWFLKPLMKYVFQTIRVPDARMRRETPEIQDAIKALDDGKCLVLFPEGYLRRKEELPLRRFGRGIWEILKERPETPVVACWIEGAWGSYSSYWNGPPMKNKTSELRRPILVGMSAPFTVPGEVLADHMKTRTHLMNAVNVARRHAGIAELPPFGVSISEELGGANSAQE